VTYNIGIVDCPMTGSKWLFGNMVENTLMIEYIEKWKDVVNKQHPNGKAAGGNKLRRYSQFKTEYAVEHYAMHVLTSQHRSALAKFRCGVAPIRVDRYEVLALEDRRCFNCIDKVEDEIHVLLHCHVYDIIHHPMLYKAEQANMTLIVYVMNLFLTGYFRAIKCVDLLPKPAMI
jgi:hypothetical protein